MQLQKNIIDCYDKTAKSYAEKFGDELANKHLDKILLNAFAEENSARGTMVDLGCGPGQTTKYLWDHGVKDIIGTDLSQAMVAVAKDLHPQIDFETADLLDLKYPKESFRSAIAFYSIVHFTYNEIKQALVEIKRVLKKDGQLLFSFHVGDKTIHLDNFLDQEVNIDFYFFETLKIKTLLIETGFEIIDIMERQPYESFEHPSTRAYIWVRSAS